MKTIVISNHKGGCAKTTTALNLSVVLASQGSRVLAVDLDPQGNLSVALGADLQELESNRATSHRMMIDGRGEEERQEMMTEVSQRTGEIYHRKGMGTIKIARLHCKRMVCIARTESVNASPRSCWHCKQLLAT